MWRGVAASVGFCAAGAVALAGQTPTPPQPTTPSGQTPTRDAATAKPGNATLRGRVTTTEPSLRPLTNARVQLSATVEPVLTDSSGRFEFTGLPAGDYTLTADKAGYAHTRYGSRHEGEPGIPIRLTDGMTLDGIEMRMPPGAAISGRVLDATGRPVVALEVTARMVQRFGNDLRLVPTFRLVAETDDRGEYRLGSLAAGRYIVAVAGITEGFIVIGGPTTWRRTTGSAQLFYPGVTAIAQAQPMPVAAGQELHGIDFTVFPSRSAKVTFAITDANGAAVQEPVALITLPGGPLQQGRGVRAVSLKTGINPDPILFEPGEWIVNANSGGRRSITRLTLADGEEVTREIVFNGGGRISGRVIFEGAGTPPPMASVTLDVREPGNTSFASKGGISRTGPATPAADGTFEITGVMGRVGLHMASTVPGWHLESALFNGQDLAETPFEFYRGEELKDVRVVLSDSIAGLTGATADGEGRPVGGCFVVLFPEARETAFSERRMRMVRSDRQGTFSMNQVPSGTYRVLATRDVEAANWMTSEYLERIRAVSQPVTVKTADRQNVKLECLQAP
jgi:hypothetical protein